MQKLFLDTRQLDSSCRTSYNLSEDIMMENAASSIEEIVRSHTNPGKKVIILCGGGNNGGDGYALSRRLRTDFELKVYECYEAKSNECLVQKNRAEMSGVIIENLKNLQISDIQTASVVVDCIFGSGFRGEISDEQIEQIITTINDFNSTDCFKIACDVPTGLHQDGTISEFTFSADITVSMGALKLCLYSDEAKDYTGKIVVANLGVSRNLFENSNSCNLETAFLLEESDMILPFRKKNFVNKGSFGSAYIASGEKIGASCIASRACLKFGAGLVSLIRPDLSFSKADLADLTCEILTTFEFGERVDSLACGMGLGHNEKEIKYYFDYIKSNKKVKAVLDADVCYSTQIKSLLQECSSQIVLTPHPKEFSALLEVCSLGEYSISECVKFRLQLTEKFCRAFPGVVLLVKGSNPMIGVFTENAGFKAYINPFGKPALAKAGSGDVLSGMICSLLAQNYSTLDATLSASLAHALASRKIKNDFALTPLSLIEAVTQL